MTYDTVESLEKAINERIQFALKMTMQSAYDNLKECIQIDFYDAYTPKEDGYVRTYQLLNSPAVYYGADNFASIYIYDGLDYKNDPGSHVVELAAYGYHGNKGIYIPSSFWENFLAWCNDELESTFRYYFNYER